MEKTYFIKGRPESKWLLMDAKNQNLGRFATQVANYLMGKHKPTFTPGVDMGDFVIVINASDLQFTPKRLEHKMYHKVSGYPGGIRSLALKEMMNRHPEDVIRTAVWGMLPHNNMGRRLLKKLKIYAGSEHLNQAQNPQVVP